MPREVNEMASDTAPRGEDSTTVLEATNVDRSFGTVEVLDDVSLALESGTVTALVGPNGSGKTTLLRVLAGVLPPTAGTVTRRGTDANREVGYMPQDPRFRAGFTASETLDFYAALADVDPDGLLERVGLGDAAGRRVEALSGGMKRLLGIAQATVGDPPIVVLDEPGSGLDPGMRRRTFEVIESLAEDGAAVVVSSHDVPLVEAVADQVVLFARGAIVARGSPEDLCRAYEEESLSAVFDTALATDDAVHVAGESE